MSVQVVPVQVVVWGMESGPAGRGRPVQIGTEVVGVAENVADVFRLIGGVGLTGRVDVVWHCGGAGDWQ